MKKTRKLLILSLVQVMSIALTSCVFGTKFRMKYREIELANYHVDNYVTAFSSDYGIGEKEKTNQLGYHKTTEGNGEEFLQLADYTISFNDDYRGRFDFESDEEKENTKKIWAHYDGDRETNGFVGNIEFKHYYYFRINLKEMNGFALNYLSGFVLLADIYGNDDGTWSDSQLNEYERTFSYDSYVAEKKEVDTASVRYDAIATKVLDEYQETLKKEFDDILGYYFDKGSDIEYRNDDKKPNFAYSDSVKRNQLRELDSIFENIKREAKDDISEAGKYKGVITTKDFRSVLIKAEDDLLNEYVKIVFEPYNDAISYYQGRLSYWQAERYATLRKISNLEKQIINAENEIDANLRENKNLRDRNTQINNVLIPNLQDDYSDYMADYRYYNSLIPPLKSEISSLEAEISSLNSEINSLERDISRLELQLRLEESKPIEEQDRDRISELKSDIQGLQTKVNSLNRQIRSINNQITSLENQITSYENSANNSYNNATDCLKRISDYRSEITKNNQTISNNIARNNYLRNTFIPDCERQIKELEEYIEDVIDPYIELHKDNLAYYKNLKTDFAIREDLSESSSDTTREFNIKHKYRLKYKTQVRQLEVSSTWAKWLIDYDIDQLEPQIQLYATKTFDTENLTSIGGNDDDPVYIENWRRNSSGLGYGTRQDVNFKNRCYMLPIQIKYVPSLIEESEEENGYNVEKWEEEYGYFNPLPELTNSSLEFNYDEVSLFIAFDYGNDQDNWNVQTTLGAVHLTPTNASYEKDLPNYTEAELLSFERESN